MEDLKDAYYGLSVFREDGKTSVPAIWGLSDDLNFYPGAEAIFRQLLTDQASVLLLRWKL